MKLDDDHLYHGGALIQIAEHEKFTAINTLKIGSKKFSNTYRINDDSAVFLKYATNPTPSHYEYVFTFTQDHISDLRSISKHCPKTYISLVCVKDREICCITHDDLVELIASRKKSKGSPEDKYNILVTAPKGKQLKVYVNAPGMKGHMLSLKNIARNAFPSVIFES
ncbi:MAG TPA: hypothetical protein VEB64_16935 [Azospirillaceae bacterium]|nr:hypothetical protein [Azospirillaceae bacterium]